MLQGSGFAGTPPPWITAQISFSARETPLAFAPTSQTLGRARTSRRVLRGDPAKPWRPIQGCSDVPSAISSAGSDGWRSAQALWLHLRGERSPLQR